MKRFCSLTLMCITLVSMPTVAVESDKSGFWIEGRVVNNGSASVIGWYERQFTDAFGFYLLGETENDGSRQMYGGPTWKPLSWLQLGIGAGRENRPNSIRRNAFVSINTEKIEGFASFETGGSGAWHRVHAVYRLTSEISAGVMDDKILGFGPRVEYNIKKNVKAWGALLHDRNTGKTESTVAINFTF